MLNSTSKDKKKAEEEISKKWKDHLWIFTDGAKSAKDKNGAAFVIPEKSIFKSERISGNLTATTCELIAIYLAMKWIQDDKASKHYAVFSDSKSSLKEICSAAEGRSSLVRSIQNIWLAEKAEKVIEFIWIPSHSGIFGNEEADRQAKAAIWKEETISVRKTHREQLYMLEEWSRKKWQEIWENPKTISGKFHFSHTPLAQTEKVKFAESRNIHKLMARMRTDRLNLNWRKFKEGNHPTGHCEDCSVKENVKHILVDCPKYSSERRDLCLRLNLDANSEVFLRELMSLSKETEATTLWKFLKNTGILARAV